MKKSRFKEIVKEVLVEDNEYQAFFQKCLDRAGKSIPEMGTQEKRDFFNKIDAAWKGRGEKRGEVKETPLSVKSSPVFEGDSVIATSLAKKFNISKKDGGITYKVVDGSKTIETDLPKDIALKLAAKKKGWSIVKESVTKPKFKKGDVVSYKNGKIGAKITNVITDNPEVEYELIWLDSKKKFTDGETNLVKFNESINTNKVDSKPIASKMRNSKTMKGFADKVEKMGKVSHKDLENLLPDYVAGKDIAGLFESKSVNEDEKKVWKYKGVLLVDSDFVNSCKGKLPNSELKHAGMGDFFLQTPDGMISFDRTNGKLDGMSGRAHQVSDNQGGKLLALLIKKMGATIVNESINESSGEMIPGVGTIDKYKLKQLLQKNKSVLDVLGKNEIDFMNRNDVDVISVSGKNYDFIFTDGTREFEIVDKDRKLKHPLRKARPEIIKYFLKNESKVNENTLSDYEKSLKSHDWTYEFSDDGSKFKRGNAQRDEINKLFDKLAKEGKRKEAITLWKKYAPGMMKDLKK